MTRLWIVRAGKQGDRELAAIEQDRLLPGFLDVGDLRRFPDRDAIPGASSRLLKNSCFGSIKSEAW